MLFVHQKNLLKQSYIAYQDMLRPIFDLYNSPVRNIIAVYLLSIADVEIVEIDQIRTKEEVIMYHPRFQEYSDIVNQCLRLLVSQHSDEVIVSSLPLTDIEKFTMYPCELREMVDRFKNLSVLMKTARI